MKSIDPLSAPRVSVVIPVRNGKDFIHEAIDSVLRQGFFDLEVIVIDDGSSDYDYKQLEAIDPRVNVLRLEGYGVSRARNTGMRVAQGEFIAFLDADDVWFPGKLEAQIRYFDQHQDVGVVFGQFVKWQPDSQGVFAPAESIWSSCTDLVSGEAGRSGWIYTKLLMGLLVGMNTAVIRRSIYYQIGEFNEAMRIGEDYDFWLRASRVAEMHSLNGPVALYRIHAASAMHKVARENHMATLLRSADIRWGISNPDQTSLIRNEFESRLAMTHFGHGYLHFWHGHLEIAKQSFKHALMGGARRGRSTLYLTATVARMLVTSFSRQPR